MPVVFNKISFERGSSISGRVKLDSANSKLLGFTDPKGSTVTLAPQSSAIKNLLVIGDSREARASVPFTALGGWTKTVTGISAGNADGSATLTFSSAHNIPVGQRVLLSPDAAIHPAFRNRWFDFSSTGATTGVISIPEDALDREYRTAYIASVTAPFVGSSPCVTIDAVNGITSSITEMCAALGQPWDDVVNLCIPGAYTADILALIKTLDLGSFSHMRLVVGINDMANGVNPATSLSNTIEIVEIASAAQLISIVSDEYPQGSMDATKQAWLRTYNSGLRDYLYSNPATVLVPAYAAINDPTTNTGSAIDLNDGTHYAANGAERIGRLAAEQLKGSVRTRQALVVPLSTKNYLSNGSMVGSAGTHTTGGSGAGQSQGRVATDWIVDPPGANVTCTARKISGVAKMWRPNTAYALDEVVTFSGVSGLNYVCIAAGTSGAVAPSWGSIPWANTTDNTVTWMAIRVADKFMSRSDWQYLQGVVGAVVTAQERVTLKQTVTLATVGLSPGDWVRGHLRVHAYDSAWRNIMFAIRSGSAIDGQFCYAADGAKNSFIAAASQPFIDREGVLRTPWWKIPAGQTSLTFYCEGGLGTGSENSTIRLMVTDALLEKL